MRVVYVCVWRNKEGWVGGGHIMPRCLESCRLLDSKFESRTGKGVSSRRNLNLKCLTLATLPTVVTSVQSSGRCVVFTLKEVCKGRNEGKHNLPVREREVAEVLRNQSRWEITTMIHIHVFNSNLLPSCQWEYGRGASSRMCATQCAQMDA